MRLKNFKKELDFYLALLSYTTLKCWTFCARRVLFGYGGNDRYLRNYSYLKESAFGNWVRAVRGGQCGRFVTLDLADV